MGQGARDRTFDEFSVGEVIHSYGRTVTEADVVLFTSLAGLKAPIFIDAEFCKRHSPFGRRIVPGLLTASIGAGMCEDVLGSQTVAALELDRLKFSAPLFPNDTVRALMHILTLRVTSDSRHGVLTMRVEMTNQEGLKVVEFTSKLLMKRAGIEED